MPSAFAKEHGARSQFLCTLTCMDQGLWTVIGVIAGSGGAITAAFITAHGARRNQLHTQRRDKRREAYASFLSAAHDLETAAYPHAANAFPSGGPPATERYTRTWYESVTDAYRKLNAAAPLVRLEGPGAVEAAAQEVLNAALLLTQSANTITQPRYSGKPGTVMAVQSGEFGDAVVGFLKAARAALNP